MNPNQIVKSPDFYDLIVKITSISQIGEMLVTFQPELEFMKASILDNKADMRLILTDSDGNNITS